jgi:hypothetical protein
VKRFTVVLLPILALILVFALQDRAPAMDASAADLEAIEAVALDYIDGYYTGDGDRMKSALHPELAKRIVAKDPKTGESKLINMSAEQLVEVTASGGGQHYLAEQRLNDVEILDVYGDVASVKITAAEWIDYMHIAKVDGDWKIINVLWEVTPEVKQKFAAK